MGNAGETERVGEISWCGKGRGEQEEVCGFDLAAGTAKWRRSIKEFRGSERSWDSEASSPSSSRARATASSSLSCSMVNGVKLECLWI